MANRLFDQLKKRKAPLVRLMVGGAFFSMLYAITRFLKFPLCPVWRLFHRPCLGCGLSRGIVALLNGNIKQASEYHILSIPVFVMLVAYYIASLIDLCFGTQLIDAAEEKLRARYMFIIYGIIYVLLLFWNIQR